VTALRLTWLLALSPDRYIGRADNLRAAANSLWLPPLRASVQSLAEEVSENLKALRFVGPHCVLPPSLPHWGLTIAFLLLASPRLAWRLLTLFYACYSYRLTHYEAIGNGVAMVFGSVVAFAIGRCVWSM
jgi:hypothetical protein